MSIFYYQTKRMEQKNTPPLPSQVSEEEFERVFEIVDEKKVKLKGIQTIILVENIPPNYMNAFKEIINKIKEIEKNIKKIETKKEKEKEKETDCNDEKINIDDKQSNKLLGKRKIDENSDCIYHQNPLPPQAPFSSSNKSRISRQKLYNSYNSCFKFNFVDLINSCTFCCNYFNNNANHQLRNCRMMCTKKICLNEEIHLNNQCNHHNTISGYYEEYSASTFLLKKYNPEKLKDKK